MERTIIVIVKVPFNTKATLKHLIERHFVMQRAINYTLVKLFEEITIRDNKFPICDPFYCYSYSNLFLTDNA